MENDCGCKRSKSSSSGEDNYLMVKATSLTSNQCGNPSDPSSNTADCAKQEPEFDSIQSSFLVPAFNNTTNIRVCNANVYSIGQWLMFINPHVVLRITNINGNDISLINACPNNVQIAENPNAGTTVNEGTRFYSVNRPPCLTDQDLANQTFIAIQNAERIRMDGLIVSTSTATIQPVGVVQSDPGDAGWTKSLYRIFGISFQGGTPLLTSLKNPVDEANQSSHYRLGINKTSKEVVPLANYSDSTGVSANGQHAVSVKSGGEKVVGPVYFPVIFQNPITLRNDTDEINITPNYNQSFTLSDPQITNTVRNQDHYYAWVRASLYFVGQGSNRIPINFFLNGFKAFTHKGYYNTSPDLTIDPFTTVYVPIRVESNNTIILNLSNPAAASGVRIGVQVIGLYI